MRGTYCRGALTSRGTPDRLGAQFVAGVAAHRCSIGRRTAAFRGDQFRAVGLHDQAAQMERAVGREDRMTGDRRAARAVEHGEHGVLGRHAGRGRLVIDVGEPGRIRASSAGIRCRPRPGRPPAASRLPAPACRHVPCPVASVRRGRAASPRRCRPRAWRAASRHCRAGSRSADRAGDAGAARAVAAPMCRRSRRGEDRRCATSPAISTSRASSRGRKAAMTRPAGCCVGMSFMLCTAASMRRASSASSISLTNSPLPPASDNGRSWMASPVVLIATISMASGAASAGIVAARASRTRPAWISASLLPRVPSLRRAAVMALL